METIKNAATAASSYLGYGTTQEDQSGQEPVSGATGAGTATEPYDQGNEVDDPALGGAAAQNTATSTSTTSAPESTEGGLPTTGLSGRSARDTADFVGAAPIQSQNQTVSGDGISGSSIAATPAHSVDPSADPVIPATTGATSSASAPLAATRDDRSSLDKPLPTTPATGATSTSGTDPSATGVTSSSRDTPSTTGVTSTSGTTTGATSTTGASSTTGATSSEPAFTTSHSSTPTNAHPSSIGGKHNSIDAAAAAAGGKGTGSSTSNSGLKDEIDEAGDGNNGGKKKLSEKIKEKLHIGNH